MHKVFFALIFVVTLNGCSWYGIDRDIPTFSYIIKKGDTLYNIGRYYGLSAAYLEDLNEIDDPRELRIGQELRIPVRNFSNKTNLVQRPATPRPIVNLVQTASVTKVPQEPVHPPDVKASQTSNKTVKLTLARTYIGKMTWPVKNGRLTSYFGSRWLNFHEGIDISASTGTPILAAHDGLVVFSDDTLRGYGNVVVVKGNGLLTVYGHCHRNLVKVGRYVKRGSLIAEVGSTGKSSGPHLHFETRVKNTSGQNVAVDPLVFYPK